MAEEVKADVEETKEEIQMKKGKADKEGYRKEHHKNIGEEEIEQDR